MTAPAAFRNFLGNQKVVDVIRRAIARGRLPHAMIFAGPDGVGRRTLALAMARALNCAAPEAARPCDECGPCRKILNGCHPDVRLIEPEGTVIKIDQIRDIVRDAAYQPFEAKTRVVILEPADQMQTGAANSMLKTLEEPPSRMVMVLVTAKPHALLTTIRSRSRTLQFAPIPAEQIEQHLVRIHGRSRDEARLAALFSRGSLGAALTFDSGDYKDARAKALEFAKLLLGHGGFAEATALVAEITRDKKDRGGFLLWLDALAGILQDVYYALTAPARFGQPDLQAELERVASQTSRKQVVSAVRAVQELRRTLNNNVNRQLAVESLFLAETRHVR